LGYLSAPRGGSHGIKDSNPAATFGYLATELGKRKIAFLFARESLEGQRLGPALKRAFGGVYIVNDGFTAEAAQAVINAGEADAVAWGKLFIANPDLPRRLQLGAALNEPVPATFYGGDTRGDTDYPSLAAGGEGGHSAARRCGAERSPRPTNPES